MNITRNIYEILSKPVILIDLRIRSQTYKLFRIIDEFNQPERYFSHKVC
jgi:hypothetical protein